MFLLKITSDLCGVSLAATHKNGCYSGSSLIVLLHLLVQIFSTTFPVPLFEGRLYLVHQIVTAFVFERVEHHPMDLFIPKGIFT